MEHPEKFQILSSISLTISTLLYIVFGCVLVILYYNSEGIYIIIFIYYYYSWC